MKKLQTSLLQNSLLFFLFQLLLKPNVAVLTASNDQQDQQIENIVQNSHQQSEKPTSQIYWAVAKGKVKGIYKTWEECLENIRDYPDAYMRTFDSVEEAKYFIDHPDEFKISLEGGSQTGQREYFYNDADDSTIKQIDGTEKERFVARPTKFGSLNIYNSLVEILRWILYF